MSFSFYLAHGGLGDFDELIFIGVSVIFVGMMAVSWIRSRNMEPEFDDESSPSQSTDGQENADHFRLD